MMNCYLNHSAIDTKWKENLDKLAHLIEQNLLNDKVESKPRSASTYLRNTRNLQEREKDLRARGQDERVAKFLSGKHH